MTDDGAIRYVPHLLLATTVLEFVHVGDEFAGNWAPFTPILEPTVAALSLGAFVLVAAAGLWWVLVDQPWGYVIAGFYGLFFLLAETWHYVDPSNMTAFRWSVVVLTQVCALALVVQCARAVRLHAPWRSHRAVEA